MVRRYIVNLNPTWGVELNHFNAACQLGREGDETPILVKRALTPTTINFLLCLSIQISGQILHFLVTPIVRAFHVCLKLSYIEVLNVDTRRLR